MWDPISMIYITETKNVMGCWLGIWSNQTDKQIINRSYAYQVFNLVKTLGSQIDIRHSWKSEYQTKEQKNHETTNIIMGETNKQVC